MQTQTLLNYPSQTTLFKTPPLIFADRKRKFLDNLLSPSGKTKYKRYLGTPLRYAGGKTLAVGHILNLLPDNIKRVVSPFIGGASVEIAIAKELDIEVIGYDIFDILINYWQYTFNQGKTRIGKNRIAA